MWSAEWISVHGRLLVVLRSATVCHSPSTPAALVSSLLTCLVYRFTSLLSPPRRARALAGDVRLIQDLILEVDPECAHIRGSVNASITVIEFGEFECPYCGQAESVARKLLADTDLPFDWRHLPARSARSR